MKLSLIDVFSYVAYLGFLGWVIVAVPHDTPAYVALALSVVCAVFWVIARMQLGDAFSVTAQARHLVTHGLYSKIRHPVYVFGTLSFLFVVLALLGWKGLTIWFIVLLVQVLRLRREEKVLAAKFGEEYAAYRKSTWF